MRQCCRHASGVRPAALGSPFLCHAAGPGRAGPGLPLRPQQHMPDPGSYVHQISRTDGFVVRARFYRTTHLRCTLHLLIAMQSPRCGKPGADPRTRLKSPPGSRRAAPTRAGSSDASRVESLSYRVSLLVSVLTLWELWRPELIADAVWVWLAAHVWETVSAAARDCHRPHRLLSPGCLDRGPITFPETRGIWHDVRYRRGNGMRISAIGSLAITGALAASLLAPRSALAWGDEGHEIVALIAQAHLDPQALKKVNALLLRIRMISPLMT